MLLRHYMKDKKEIRHYVTTKHGNILDVNCTFLCELNITIINWHLHGELSS